MLLCHSCRWWGLAAGQACDSVQKYIPPVTKQTRCRNARAGIRQAFARPEYEPVLWCAASVTMQVTAHEQSIQARAASC